MPKTTLNPCGLRCNVSLVDFSSLLRPELAELSAYVPQGGDYEVRLDANEAPARLGEEARRRLASAVVPDCWERYPDASQVDLRRAIGDAMGVAPECIVAGCGTDEIIALLLDALDRPRQRSPAATVVTTTPTFSMYAHGAKARGMKVLQVPLDASWDLSTASMIKAIEMARPNVVFIASPNNPTGALMSEDRLEEVVTHAEDSFVVIDEAYVDYAPRDQLELLKRHPHVGILRTLSKVGFAALRVGWLVAPAELVHELDKLRQPFNLSSGAQRAATVVLGELPDELARVRAEVIDERAWLAAALEALGWGVAHSDANFLWVETPGPAEAVHTALRERGVLVRSFHDRGGRLARRLRITIGRRPQHEQLLSALRTLG